MNAGAILRSPLIYMLFQKLVGGMHVRNVCLEILNLQPGERVLDIGCGPAYYLNKMPQLEYFGFDTDRRYIEYARARFGTRGNFFCDAFDEQHAIKFGPFNCIMLMGLLHHLDDTACHQLLALVASVLAPGGRIIALDTVVHARQNRFERFFAISDRGKYVRRPEQFTSLATTSFNSAVGALIEAWWIPSTFWHMVLREPRIMGHKNDV